MEVTPVEFGVEVVVRDVMGLVEPLAGRHGNRLPVEVAPFAEVFVARAIDRLGLEPEPWCVDGRRGLTDNGNHILDCRLVPTEEPAEIDRAIRGLPGVVGTGFFLQMADCVLEGDESFRLVREHVRAAVVGAGDRGRQAR